MALVLAALTLGLERACYVWVSRYPEQFRAWCSRWPRAHWTDPVLALRDLCGAFKILQATVFLIWCGVPVAWPPPEAVLFGVLLLCAGQALNLSVFHKLGTVGVFYGNRFGYPLRWHEGFPFSLTAHPQYVGVVMSIWGVFLLAEFPEPYWYALPTVETALYALGGALER